MSSSDLPVLVVEIPATRWQWRPVRWRLRKLIWWPDGQWTLAFASQTTDHAVLRPDAWRSAWLISLRWRLESGRVVRHSLYRWQVSPVIWHSLQLRLALKGGVSTRAERPGV